VRASAVPVIDGARALAEAGQIPGGSKRNRTFVEPSVRFEDEVDEVTRMLLADAQTSGGMLIACPPDSLVTLLAAMKDGGTPIWEIGAVTDGAAGTIEVEA
jgi:selenide,water dikinase